MDISRRKYSDLGLLHAVLANPSQKSSLPAPPRACLVGCAIQRCGFKDGGVGGETPTKRP